MNSHENHTEPVFSAVSALDSEVYAAHALAARTLPQFISLLQQQEEAIFSVKLSFRDPDESERKGVDRFVFLWLTAVEYHGEKRVFSGIFFELPAAFQKWHHAGQELIFEAEDIFDWMMLCDAHLRGGASLRVTRSRLPESERESYDRHIGVSIYEPLLV